MSERLAERYLADPIKRTYATIMVSAGMLTVDLLAHGDISTRLTDSLKDQALAAYPSAIAASRVTGEKTLDEISNIVPAAASLQLAGRTNSARELFGVAVAAQGLASAATIGSESLLNSSERSAENDGFSAIWTAWTEKYLLDRKKYKAAAGFAGAVIGGSYMVDRDHWLSDSLAHGSGIAVAIGAKALGNFWQNRSNKNAAAQAELAPVENRRLAGS